MFLSFSDTFYSKSILPLILRSINTQPLFLHLSVIKYDTVYSVNQFVTKCIDDVVHDYFGSLENDGKQKNKRKEKMKKFIMTVAVLSLGMLALAGCGKKEEDMKYLSDFDASDYVTLGDYKGLVVDATAKQVVNDDELDNYVQYVVAGFTETVDVTDRDTVQSGDVANIDYEGKKDGVAFEGGTAEGYDLEIGSGTFIPGFEDGVIGMKVGETKDIDLSFPENYASEELAGQAVVFTVKLNGIKEKVAPEINDDLAKKTGFEGVTTVDELKEYLKNDLQSGYDAEYDAQLENLLEKALEDCSQIEKIPSGFQDRIYTKLKESIAEMAASYGVEEAVIASYYYGIDSNNYEEGLKSYVNDTLCKQYLLLGAVAEKEGIKVSDADVDADLTKTLEESGSTMTLDEYKEMLGDTESYKEYLIISKAVEVLKENATINEK